MDAIAAILADAKFRGGQYVRQCPAHEDKKASLCIRECEDRWLFHCHAGCNLDAVCAAFGIEKSRLFKGKKQGYKRRRWRMSQKPDFGYHYCDQHGAVLYTVHRFPNKEFRQSHTRTLADGATSQVWGMEGVERVLYRLPRVLEAIEKRKPVWIVEGEKDVHMMENLKFYATTNAGGAGKWLPAYTETLKRAHVIILPDNDAPGRQHAYRVAEALIPACESVRILNLPYVGDKGDVSDYVKIRAGEGLDTTSIAKELFQLAWAEKPLCGKAEQDAPFREAMRQALLSLSVECGNPYMDDAAFIRLLKTQVGALLPKKGE